MAIIALALHAPRAVGSLSHTSLDVAAIDHFIQRQISAGSIPGAALAITHGDEVVYVRGYGHDSNGDPITEQTLFRIASVSKSFTSLAVMQLVDEGLVALDDAVVSHLPEFHPADPRGADITVRQLLDQTSGLADREIPEMSRRQPDDLVEAVTSLNSAHLVAAPGTQWNYHNPNYHVAARLVEFVSGEPFDTYLTGHVFRPTGMTSSTTTNFNDEPVDELVDGHVVAYGHAFSLAGPHIFTAGAGGVVTDASDMARWLIVNTNEGRSADGTRVISADGLRELHAASAPSGYALGWDTYGPVSSPNRLEHSGNLFTFSAYEAVLPDSGYGVALLFNSSSGLMRDQNAIFSGVMKIVDGSDVSPDGPGLSTKTIDLVLAVLTGIALILGIRGVVRSRRWSSKHTPFRTRSALRFVPYLAAIVLLASYPRIAGSLVGGRDVSWETAAYGWPALVVFVLSGLFTTSATVISRTWHLFRDRRRRSPTTSSLDGQARPREDAIELSKDPVVEHRSGRDGDLGTGVNVETTEGDVASGASRGTSMRAVVYREYGSTDVLRVEQIERPEASEKEVLVRVHAAGLDRGTWHFMTGLPYLGRLAFGLRAPRNLVLGLDVAGTVVEVGSKVTRFRAGDEVFGVARGSFAEYAVAREDKLAPKPTRLTFEQAAVVPVSATTALQGLRNSGRLQAGQKVLIVGASGGVGTYAVQIAKALGAEVTGVCSTSKVDLVRSIGADRVIDYMEEDFADGSSRYDLILDIGGNRRLSVLRRALGPKGTLVFVGGEEGGKLTGGMNRQISALVRSLFVRQRFTMFVAKENHTDLETLRGFIEADELTPFVDKIYPLAEVPDAMRRLEAGDVRGKIAIAI